MARIRQQVGSERVICALSGGVDSAVAALLVHKAVGDQLTCIFVDHGLLRQGEAEQVVETFGGHLEVPLVHVQAQQRFLALLAGVTDPVAPDVILALSSAALAPLLEVDRAVPIVFAGIADPVAAGYVESLSRPGGNATGFTIYEYSIGGKWLELLKEMAPHVTRVAVLRETGIAAGPGVFGAMQALAPSLGLDLRPVNVQEASDIERAITAFAQNNPRGGVVASGSPSQSRHRQVIIALAAEHRLPTVYNARFFAVAGGLISYGADFLDQSRRAAAYVDRILRGEKPADLPVQSPTKYELVINLKTAKTLGIIMPPSLLARANEVIE